MRAIDLARQEIQTLRRSGLNDLANRREQEVRALEQQAARFRAIVGK